MDYLRLRVLFHEFSKKLEEQHTYYLDSVVGFSVLHKRVSAEQLLAKEFLSNSELTNDDFLDTCSTIYSELSDKDVTPVSLSPVMKQGEVKTRTKENGSNYFLLGANCLVSLYGYWEEYLRVEIGIAMGVLEKGSKNCEKTRSILSKHVISNIWGDIRYLRHSILHNNSIANKDVVRCKILKYFSPGDSIKLDFNKMQAIFLFLAEYRNEIHRMSFPPSEGIKIPSCK